MRTQSEIGRALEEAREQTDALFGAVRPDSFYERPIPERHRIVFYLGHVEAFDWNLIGRYALDRRSFHPDFDQLFAFGIDPPPGQLPADRPSDWPSLAEVERYNHRVRDEIDDLADEVPEHLLHVAVEHRLMHLETFAYILHQLDYERKVQPSWQADMEMAQPPRPRMIDIPAGAAQLGLNSQTDFGWDNEFQSVAVDVPTFAISKYKVTNGEYLEFVRAGAAAPAFWTKIAGRWFHRGMFAKIPLNPDWPVYVTHSEAAAYADWRGAALPSEPQFHRAMPAGQAEPKANLDFRRWDPIPVHANDDGSAAPSQMVGNGWEWTSTIFAPFPGFAPFPFYKNYSEPFFDGRHYVLKGASPRTAARLTRPSFRNWFRPHYPYIYATFRLVEA